MVRLFSYYYVIAAILLMPLSASAINQKGDSMTNIRNIKHAIQPLQTLVIEEYSPAYQDQVGDLIVTVQTAYGVKKPDGSPITIKDQPDLENIANFYQQGTYGPGSFLIARKDSIVIGTAALVNIGNQQAVLRKMFVCKDHEGQGIAKKLLHSLVLWAQANGIKEILLGTIEKTFIGAVGMYKKKYGFEPIDKDKLPTNFPIMSVDDIFLVSSVDKLLEKFA